MTFEHEVIFIAMVKNALFSVISPAVAVVTNYMLYLFCLLDFSSSPVTHFTAPPVRYEPRGERYDFFTRYLSVASFLYPLM